MKTWMKAVVATSTMLAVAACSGDGGGGGSTGTDGSDGATGTSLPSNVVTKQEAIETSDWDAVVAKNPNLKSVLNTMASSGMTTVVATGETADDAGTTLTWAVLTDGTNEATAALACSDGICEAARIDTSSGKAVFTDASGASIDPLLTVAPTMLKQVEGGDIAGKTTIVSGLTADEVPAANVRRRRFTLANAYGDVFGVTWDSVAKMASDSGAFTEVANHQYAGRAVLADAIGAASPFDVLVWVGAAVRQPFGTDFKTVGMTVNRGVYGDETFTSAQVRELMKAAPYGGPGLVLLVGEMSRGDGSDQVQKAQSLVQELVQQLDSPQIVVGVTGRAPAQAVLDASSTFLNRFMAGDTLADALTAGNAVFEAAGSSAILESNKPSTADNITFVGNLSEFWGGAGNPSTVVANHYLSLNHVCGSSPQGQNTANFFVEVNFDGPFFTGTRQFETNGVPLEATVEGVLLGREIGDRLYIKYSGDIKPSIKGITVWGSGVVVEPKGIDKPPPGRVYYEGTAIATNYTDENGDECVVGSPQLSGTTSAQLSSLDLPE